MLLMLFAGEAAIQADPPRSTDPSSQIKPPSATQGAIVHLIDAELSHFDRFLEHQGLNQDPDGVFSVQDGVLRMYGEEFGALMTREEYENYRLTFEFKWGEKTIGLRASNARDSGVWPHSRGEPGAVNGAFMAGIEINILEGGTGDILVLGDRSDRFAISALARPAGSDPREHIFDPDHGKPVTGLDDFRVSWWGKDPHWKDVTGFRGSRDVEKPRGQWNRMEYVALGGQISVILNGVLVNQCHNVRPRKGKIQVQTEGAEIYFRNLQLKRLTGTDEDIKLWMERGSNTDGAD